MNRSPRPCRLLCAPLAVAGLFAPSASADIVLADEGFRDRSADPTTMAFSVYNNFGLAFNGGSTMAEVGVVNPLTGTPGDAISGTRSLTMFAVDDHVFTGSGEIVEVVLGDEGPDEKFFMPLVGTNESTTAERNMSQFDVANGGTGTFEMQFSYRVANISFVDGFDGGGPLPDALELERFRMTFTDSEAGTEDPIAGAIGVSPSNPFPLIFDDQWHTETITFGVLDEAARDGLQSPGGAFSEDVATILQVGVTNLGDLAVNRKIAYEVFFDDFRILTAAAVAGDYNNDGSVDQGDLDLVLLNWGDDASVTGVPTGWVNEQPTGLIGQTELDGVLLGWGNTAESAAASAVPEPTTAALLTLGGLAALRRRHA